MRGYAAAADHEVDGGRGVGRDAARCEERAVDRLAGDAGGGVEDVCEVVACRVGGDASVCGG